MQSIILCLCMILLAYLLSERAFRIRRFKFEFLIFFIYGLEFVLLGFLFGPQVANILSLKILADLAPVLSIALGWIGLLFGLQFRVKDLRVLAPSNYLVSGLLAIICFLIVFIYTGIIGFVWFAKDLPASHNILLALSLAAISIPSAPTVIVSAARRLKAHGRTTRLLRYVSSIDALPAIILFGVVSSLLHFQRVMGTTGLEGWQWLLLSLFLGSSLGLLFHLVFSLRLSGNERLAMAVGAVIFSSGLAYYLHLSALFCNFIVGLVLANMNTRYDKLHRLLASAEKPLYGLLLIFSGALWQPYFILLVFALLIVFGRALGKIVGGYVALKHYGLAGEKPHQFGMALLAQGGVAIAMALDFRAVYQQELGNLIVTIVVTTFLLNGFISLFTVKEAMLSEGEVK